MDFAERISTLRPEGAYTTLARAKALEAQGREIIHLEIGQPDFDTPSHVALAGIRAIAEGKTRYVSPAGIAELRRALAQDANRRLGTSYTPEQVVVTPGTKLLVYLPMLALLEPGDEVIYPDPGFPAYEAAIHLVGARPVPVPLDAGHNFDLDLAAFDACIGPRTRMIVLNSPHNPTGGVLSRRALEHIAQVAIANDCWVISDEVYSRLVYDGEALSIASLPGMAERTIIADGFSKAYAMTGWRLGFGLMPAPLSEKLDWLLTHTVSCTAPFTQLAGLAAISGPQGGVEAMRAELRRRRDRIVAGLNAIPGIRCNVPRGAFYVFPDITSFGRPAAELADYLLERAGVAVLPGTAFGPNGEGHLRISYANTMENIERALERIHDALG